MAKKKQNIIESENILLGNSTDNDKLKDELMKYVDEKVNKTFIDEIEKLNKKILHEKRRKIIVRNIIILILLAVVGFLMYLLYTNRYFDQYFNNGTSIIDPKEEKNEDNKKEIEKDEPKEPTLDELKSRYSNLLDNYSIGDNSAYITDLYNGNLSNNLKKYFTLNSLDLNSIKQVDGYQIIENNTFKIAYENLFNDAYNTGDFDYNDNLVRYVSVIDAYITTKILEKSNQLVREVVDIKLDNDKVNITTVEGIIRDNKLYKITDNSEIVEYSGDSLINYQESLNKIIYTFKDNKLVSLSKGV